jgi:serine/threonine protein kinase
MQGLGNDDPRVIGEYRLQACLGSGGIGRVYLGLSPVGRAVAVKVLHPGLAGDAKFLRRFGQEVAAARAVSGIYTARSSRPGWTTIRRRLDDLEHSRIRRGNIRTGLETYRSSPGKRR